MAIHAQKRHTIARRNTQTLQSSPKPARAVGKLCVGEPHVAANDPELVRKLLLGVSQKTNRSQWNFHGLLTAPAKLSVLRQPPAHLPSHNLMRSTPDTPQLPSNHHRHRNDAPESAAKNNPCSARSPLATYSSETSPAQSRSPEYCVFPICTPNPS